MVEPAAQGEREPIGQVQGIGGVDPGERGVGAELHGAIGQPAGRADDLACARYRRGGSHRQVREDHAERAAGREADPAAVEARPGGEQVGVAPHPSGVCRLDRDAKGQGVGSSSIQRAVWDAVARRALAGRGAVDRLAVRAKHLEILGRRAERCRETVILDAQRAEQWIGWIIAAALEVPVVAVEVVLAELTQVEAGLHRPGPRAVEPAVQGDQARPVQAGLGVGVDRAPVGVQQIHRRGANHPEVVAAAHRQEVDLCRRALPADVGIGARYGRGRGQPPARVTPAVRGQIDRPGSVHRTVLG